MIKFNLKKLLFLISMFINSSTIFTMEPDKKLYLLLTKEDGTIETQPIQVLWKNISQFNSIKNMIEDSGSIPNEPIPLYKVTYNQWTLINDLANQQITAEQIPLTDLKAIIIILNYLDPSVESIKPAKLIKTYAHKLIVNKEPYKDALFNINDLDNLLIKAAIEEISQSLPSPMQLNLKENTQQLIQELIAIFENPSPQSNINIQAKRHIAALNFIKMAYILDLPLLENACAQYLAKYLSIYCKYGNPDKKRDYTQQGRDKKQFLDQLYALPYETQKKINLVYRSVPNPGLTKKFIHLFTEQMIKNYHHPVSNMAWSADSKYFYMKQGWASSGKKIVYIRWNMETDEKAHMLATNNELINQGLNNFTQDPSNLLLNQPISTSFANSPDNMYIVHFNEQNKPNCTITLTDVKTNQLIETFSVRVSGFTGTIIKPVFLWSPDSKNLAFMCTHHHTVVYPIDLLIQSKKELEDLPLSQLLFVMYLLDAGHGNMFGVSWQGNKIRLKKEQQEEFELLPKSLKEIFKSKIATQGPHGYYY